MISLGIQIVRSTCSLIEMSRGGKTPPGATRTEVGQRFLLSIFINAKERKRLDPGHPLGAPRRKDRDDKVSCADRRSTVQLFSLPYLRPVDQGWHMIMTMI